MMQSMKMWSPLTGCHQSRVPDLELCVEIRSGMVFAWIPTGVLPPTISSMWRRKRMMPRRRRKPDDSPLSRCDPAASAAIPFAVCHPIARIRRGASRRTISSKRDGRPHCLFQANDFRPLRCDPGPSGETHSGIRYESRSFQYFFSHDI